MSFAGSEASVTYLHLSIPFEVWACMRNTVITVESVELGFCGMPFILDRTKGALVDTCRLAELRM